MEKTTHTMPRTPWLTKRQAAQYLGVSQKTIDRLRERKDLRTYLIVGTSCLRFRVEDLDALRLGA
jgi:excisionase family DNA binding protein